MKNVYTRGGLPLIALLCVLLYTPIPAHALCDTIALQPVQHGDNNSAVVALQQCLIGAGYSIPAGATGYYGSQTTAAVTQYSTAELALHTSGQSTTAELLAALGASPEEQTSAQTLPLSVSGYDCEQVSLASATYGNSNNAVVQLQKCLLIAGYSIPAGATGYYGAQTQSAVRAFYTDVIKMPEWHGNSIGPIGRSALASRIAERTMTPSGDIVGYKFVADASELLTYLEAERSYGSFSNELRGVTLGRDDGDMLAMELAAPTMGTGDDTAKRVSETNVQVAGIDEPDIVKTDGDSLFISRQSRWYGWREPMIMMDVTENSSVMPVLQHTTVVDAFPLEDLAVVSDEIEEVGEMLLVKSTDTLIIFSRPNIVAYDVSDQDDPEKLWEFELEDRSII